MSIYENNSSFESDIFFTEVVVITIFTLASTEIYLKHLFHYLLVNLFLNFKFINFLKKLLNFFGKDDIISRFLMFLI